MNALAETAGIAGKQSHNPAGTVSEVGREAAVPLLRSGSGDSDLTSPSLPALSQFSGVHTETQTT